MNETPKEIALRRRAQPSTGTWLLVLLVVVVVEYTIEGWVRDYGADPAVLSHVSFAGTIISSILAVLAILYSYFQNFAQQRDSASISFQIEELRRVIERIQGSERTLSIELERFEDLSKKIDRTISIGEESKRAVERVATQLDLVKGRAETQGGVATSGVPSQHDASNIGQLLLRNGRLLTVPILYAIHLGVKHKLTSRETADRYVIPATTKTSGNALLAQWADGVFTGYWNCLAADDTLETEGVPAKFKKLEEGFEGALAIAVTKWHPPKEPIISIVALDEIEKGVVETNP